MKKIVVLICFCTFAAPTPLTWDFPTDYENYEEEPSPFDYAMAIGRLDFVPLGVIGIGFGKDESGDQGPMNGNYDEVKYSLQNIWNSLQRIKRRAARSSRKIDQDLDVVIKQVEVLQESLEWCEAPPYDMKKVDDGKEKEGKARKEDKKVKDDKATKEDKTANDEATKEDKKVDEKATKEDKKVNDKATKEDKKVDEKATKEDKKVNDKVAKEDKNANDDKATKKDKKAYDDKAIKERKKEKPSENQKQQFTFQDLLNLARFSKESKDIFNADIPKEFYDMGSPKELGQQFFYYETDGEDDGKQFIRMDGKDEGKALTLKFREKK